MKSIIKMLKKTFEQLAVALVASFFLFDAINKIFDTQKETWILNYKCQQIETTLHNYSLLPF